MVQQLLRNKFLSITNDQYATLKLNEKSWQILKGESQIKLVMKKEKAQIGEHDEPEFEQGLLRELPIDGEATVYDSNLTPHHHLYHEDTGEVSATGLYLLYE